MKKGLLSLVFLFSVSLIGCHSNVLSNNLKLPEDLYILEVYEWNSDTLVTTINDNELIDKLVKKLNSAKIYSTANMDYPLPDYELVFKNNEEEGYFQHWLL